MTNQLSTVVCEHHCSENDLSDKEVKHLSRSVATPDYQLEREKNANEISVIKTAGPSTERQDKSTHSEMDSSSFKKKRSFFTCFQKLELEEIFFQNPYPSKEMCEYLAPRFGSTPHSMKIWFKNRRARQRKTSQPQQTNCQLPHPLPHPLQHNQTHVNQLCYNPPTVRKQPSGPRVTLGQQDPSTSRRSAFSLYRKNCNSQE